jgi:hypothetical protein
MEFLGLLNYSTSQQRLLTWIITRRTYFDNSYLEWEKYGPVTVQSDLQKYSNTVNNIAIY